MTALTEVEVKEKKYKYKSGANSAGHSLSLWRTISTLEVMQPGSLLPVTNANVYTEIVAL